MGEREIASFQVPTHTAAPSCWVAGSALRGGHISQERHIFKAGFRSQTASRERRGDSLAALWVAGHHGTGEERGKRQSQRQISTPPLGLLGS